MKRFAFSIVALMLLLGLSAQPVSEQEALQKARKFLHGKNLVSASDNVGTRGVRENPYQHLYLFNAEGDGGFVIVAGDSRAREILGYSDTGHLDLSQMPENMKWWLSSYEESIANISDDAAPAQTRAEDSKPDIAPMMSFSWSQMYPYNYYCPQGCLSGCVPTAMAQMMAYYKYPTNLPALDGYTDINGNYVDALQANYVDYSDMSGYNPAVLVRYCGQTVQTAYGSQVTLSTGVLVPSALVNNFGFDSGAHNVFRSAYNSQEWDDLLYKELSEGRPFILSGMLPDQSSGHAFICHGYSQGYYAVNWGWGGQENGYFAMSALTTTQGDYSSGLVGCLGIRPPAGGVHDYPPFSFQKMEVTSALTVERSPYTSAFEDINISWAVRNSLLEPTEYQFALVLFKPDGNTDILINYNPVTYEPSWTSNANPVISIGSQYGDGTYRISLMGLNTGTQSWDFFQGMYWRYIQAVISGNTITFTNYPNYDAPYETGPYPPYYPIYPDYPDIPDGPDDPDNPDYPDDPDDPEVEWPEANVTIEYPVMKARYEGDFIAQETNWGTLSALIQNQLGMTAAAFDDNYRADCFDDDFYTPVAAEDAPYVTPYAYNFNSEGDLESNWYDLKLFNFGSDLLGNGGTPPASGDAEPEWDYVAVAAYAPHEGIKGNHVISFELSDFDVQGLTAGKTSPVTFTRWARYTAKKNLEGVVAAPYRYVWVTLPMDISWGAEDPDAISTIKTDTLDDGYYDLRGQKVSNSRPTRKGVYIRNGKKVVIK